MKKYFNSMLMVCLLAFTSMQMAQATSVYESFSTVPGFPGIAPATFSETDTFWVDAGHDYLAVLTDIGTVVAPIFDNFDALSMVVLDDYLDPVDFLALAPVSGSGYTSVSFSFTAATSTFYNVSLAGITDAMSTYTAVITDIDEGMSPVPVPSAILLMGSAMFALVGLGRRKIL